MEQIIKLIQNHEMQSSDMKTAIEKKIQTELGRISQEFKY